MISSFQVFHFPLVIWPFFQISNGNFHFNFSNFFISNFKNENFQFFHFKFPWHISIFYFPLVVWPNFVKFQIRFFFNFFHFPLMVLPIFFNSNFKNNFFEFSLWHKRIFSAARGCQIYLKITKSYLLTLSTNSHILHMVVWSNCKIDGKVPIGVSLSSSPGTRLVRFQHEHLEKSVRPPTSLA
jgi:hypothetical protein